MPGYKCPACRQILDEIWFQPPIMSCLYCYARLPTNRDLWEVIDSGDPDRATKAWGRLRERAYRAPYAKTGKAIRKQRRADLLGMPIKPSLDEPIVVRPSADIEAELAGIGGGLIHCDGCSREFEVSVLTEIDAMPSEEKAYLCRRCAEEIEGLDKQCSICQKRFPLTSMHMREAKVYCEECIKEKNKPPVTAILDRARGSEI